MHKSSIYIYVTFQDRRRILNDVSIFKSDPIFTRNLMDVKKTRPSSAMLPRLMVPAFLRDDYGHEDLICTYRVDTIFLR